MCYALLLTGSNGDSLFGRHLTIGAAIGLFCEDLSDEIRSRTYFYKNSKLVTKSFGGVFYYDIQTPLCMVCVCVCGVGCTGIRGAGSHQ